jgi:two-component system catabolic regulation response regulator CreB
MPIPAVTPVRILVVEDEPAIADTLLYALHSEGFGAEHVVLGRQALLRHGEQPFDLIILDVGLPDMTGFDVLRGLRADGGATQVPVILLTARGEEIDRVLGLELGADDYVVKPFSPREVAARVRAILRRGAVRPPAPAQKVASGPWRCQPEALRIDYHGVTLDLTRYEYRLLDLLLSHPGRVFSREQIMASVWENALDTSDRTVDAHVKTLRAKLRAVRADEDPIRTHRGVGYALVA